jgi:urease accessory protein
MSATKQPCKFTDQLSPSSISAQSHAHSHDNDDHSHSHDHGDHGHTHEHLEHAGKTHCQRGGISEYPNEFNK